MVEAKAARGNPRQERPDLQPNQSPPRQPPTLLDRDHWCCHRWQWLWQGRCWFRRRQVADDVSEAAHQARPHRPISKPRTVPETAPTATNRPATLAHRRASRGCGVIARDSATMHHEIIAGRRLQSTQARCESPVIEPSARAPAPGRVGLQPLARRQGRLA